MAFRFVMAVYFYILRSRNITGWKSGETLITRSVSMGQFHLVKAGWRWWGQLVCEWAPVAGLPFSCLQMCKKKKKNTLTPGCEWQPATQNRTHRILLMTSQEDARKTHPYLCKVCEDYKGLFNASKNFRFHICWHWWSHMINEPVLWQLLIQDPQNRISFFPLKLSKVSFLHKCVILLKLILSQRFLLHG